MDFSGSVFALWVFPVIMTAGEFYVGLCVSEALDFSLTCRMCGGRER